MKIWLLLLSVFWLLVTPALADLNQGMSAYEQGNYVKAFREFKALAEEGNADAQLMLGYLYAEGEGVLQNFVEAHKWFNLSASRGNSRAKKARNIITDKMTPEQIAAAQQLARKWQPTIPTGKTAEATSKRAEAVAKPVGKPSRNQIREIQRILVEYGYDAGVPDGVIGARTRSAIQKYQADVGLMVDGKVSKALLEHLKTATKPARAPKPAPATIAKAKSKEGPGEDVQALVDGLRDVTAEVERRGGADRWVLDRLRALVRQYDWPWRFTIMEDNFADGDYTANPSWTVDAGQFLVDAKVGLRSIVTKKVPKPEEPRDSREELTTAIFGAILKQMAPEEPKEAKPAEAEYAEIHVARAITNAFAMNIIIISQGNEGLLEFGPYRGADRGAGYRLAYSPGAEGKLELLGLSYTRSSVIEIYNKPLNLSDGRQHTLLWTRDTNGEMTVSVDGTELFRVTDKRFPDAFSGFTLVNRGGDYGIRQITITGAKK